MNTITQSTQSKIINRNFAIRKNKNTNFKASQKENICNKPMIKQRDFKVFESDEIKILTYDLPVTLEEALQDIIETKELNTCIVGEKNIIKQFLQDLPDEIKQKKVTGINGYGTSAVAFDTEDGKILKISCVNHFPLNRPRMDFDVPIYQSGHRKNTYYYIQEKLFQHSMPEYYTQMIKEKINASGFKAYDLYNDAPHQIGISKDGNLYLLDTECVRYKSIFHALFDKAKRFAKKIKL